MFLRWLPPALGSPLLVFDGYLVAKTNLSLSSVTYNALDAQMRDKLKKLGLESHDYVDHRTGDAYLIYSFGYQSENKTERGK
jgi:hypothetical protein